MFKKKLNASKKPSEHPPSGEQMSKGLGRNIGYRDKTSSWYQTGSPTQPYRVNSIISGRNPPFYCCTLTLLISVQGHQNHNLSLFLTFSVLVVNSKKNTLHGGQFRSWSAEQGKENKRKRLAAYPPPPSFVLIVGLKEKSERA